LKIDPKGDPLTPLPLGDSGKLQVGQTVIAIGTSLGQFNNSVTTGVISGLGRGITAGDPFEGFAEELDDVIQTDAAINPGNSGGPLLNASGQVIGVNTAVSQSGQNIGFALPINVVRTSLDEFNNTGQFNRPFLGVSYRMIPRDLSLRAEVPQGAYVESVVDGSSAAKGGVQSGDIITEFDGTKLAGESTELSKLIAKKKVGDTVKVKVYRENGSEDLSVTLEAAPEQ
jgi:serine protease Do